MINCKNCGAKIDPENRYCENCGSECISKDVYCRICGNQMPESNKFCTKCGAVRVPRAAAMAAPAVSWREREERRAANLAESEESHPKAEGTFHEETRHGMNDAHGGTQAVFGGITAQEVPKQGNALPSGSESALLKNVCARERITSIIWAFVGILQIILAFSYFAGGSMGGGFTGLIFGAFNMLVGVAGIRGASNAIRNPANIVKSYRKAGGLVFVLIYNTIIGIEGIASQSAIGVLLGVLAIGASCFALFGTRPYILKHANELEQADPDAAAAVAETAQSLNISEDAIRKAKDAFNNASTRIGAAVSSGAASLAERLQDHDLLNEISDRVRTAGMLWVVVAVLEIIACFVCFGAAADVSAATDFTAGMAGLSVLVDDLYSAVGFGALNAASDLLLPGLVFAGVLGLIVAVLSLLVGVRELKTAKSLTNDPSDVLGTRVRSGMLIGLLIGNIVTMIAAFGVREPFLGIMALIGLIVCIYTLAKLNPELANRVTGTTRSAVRQAKKS